MEPIDITGINWKLTLPTGSAGKPTELTVGEFSKLKNDFFFIQNNALVMHAPCNGFTTPNSTYPRCELREIIGINDAAWDCSKGTHSMIYKISCNHLPKNKPQLVMGQIHGTSDDIIEIRLTGSHLEVIHNSTVYGTLLTNYKLGTFIEIKIIAEKNQINVTYLNKTITVKPKTTKGFYFKVGCYVQSNASKGDGNDYGEISLQKVTVSHK